MPVTLRDIAAACGMDVSTVSRALRGDVRVKADTRTRIEQIASRLGYEPNLAARSLVGARSSTVWFVTPSVTNQNEQRPAVIASKLLAAGEYDLLLMLYHGDEQRYVHILKRLEQGVADGAIIIPNPLGAGRAELERLAERSFPLVFMDRHPEFSAHPTVTTDNRLASTMLVERALEGGADAFVLLYGDHNTVELDRRDGAMRALGSRGVPFSIGADDAERVVRDAHTVCVGSSVDVRNTAFASENAPLLEGKRVIFTTFDKWAADPRPAELVCWCEQDFEAMAKLAVDAVRGMIAGDRVEPGVTLVPPVGIHTVTSTSP